MVFDGVIYWGSLQLWDDGDDDGDGGGVDAQSNPKHCHFVS